METEYVDRELAWREDRCGNITSSCLGLLMKKGRKDEDFGKSAIGYMYEKRYERRTGRPVRNKSNANFDWGHEQEPLAVEWLRFNYPMWNVRSCTTDFPAIVFVKPFPDVKFGDSPDVYLEDDAGGLIAIGEIKCLESQAKFERYMDCTKADLVDEYRDQLAGHFLAHPGIEVLYYVLYDGQSEFDDFDTLPVTDPSRGRVLTYFRSDFGLYIEKLEARIREADFAIDKSLELGVKIETLLKNY